MKNPTPRAQSVFTPEEKEYWRAIRFAADERNLLNVIHQQIREVDELARALRRLKDSTGLWSEPATFRHMAFLAAWCETTAERLMHSETQQRIAILHADSEIPETPDSFKEGERSEHE